MSKSDEWTGSWAGTVWGEQIGGDLPKNHLAFVDSHRIATAERVQAARLYWIERSPKDFRRYGSTNRKFSDVTTGELYALCEIDPFQADNPADAPITCFVQNGGWIFYLKPYGTGVPEAGTGLDAATYGGQVMQDRKTLKPVLASAGRRIRSRLTEEGKSL